MNHLVNISFLLTFLIVFHATNCKSNLVVSEYFLDYTTNKPMTIPTRQTPNTEATTTHHPMPFTQIIEPNERPSEEPKTAQPTSLTTSTTTTTEKPILCSSYNSKCGRCLEKGISSNCGWCDSKCSTKNECLGTFSNNNCPPIIYSVFAEKMSNETNYVFDVIGDNFPDDENKCDTQAKFCTENHCYPCHIVKLVSTYIQCTSKIESSNLMDKLVILTNVNRTNENKHSLIGNSLEYETENDETSISEFNLSESNLICYGKNLFVNAKKEIIVKAEKETLSKCHLIKLDKNQIECNLYLFNETECKHKNCQLHVLYDDRLIYSHNLGEESINHQDSPNLTLAIIITVIVLLVLILVYITLKSRNNKNYKSTLEIRRKLTKEGECNNWLEEL